MIDEDFAIRLGWREKYAKDLFGRDIGGYGGGTIQWDEKDHPRDEDGKFVDKGGGESGKKEGQAGKKRPKVIEFKGGFLKGSRWLFDPSEKKWKGQGDQWKHKSISAADAEWHLKKGTASVLEEEDDEEAGRGEKKEVAGGLGRILKLRTATGVILTYDKGAGEYRTPDGKVAIVGDVEKHAKQGSVEVLEREGDETGDKGGGDKKEGGSKKEGDHPLEATMGGKLYRFDRNSGKWYDPKDRHKEAKGVDDAIKSGAAKVTKTYKGKKVETRTETVKTMTISKFRLISWMNGEYTKREDGNWTNGRQVFSPSFEALAKEYQTKGDAKVEFSTKEVTKKVEGGQEPPKRKYKSFEDLREYTESKDWKQKISDASKSVMDKARGEDSRSEGVRQSFREKFKAFDDPFTLIPQYSQPWPDKKNANKALEFFEENAAFREMSLEISRTSSRRASASGGADRINMKVKDSPDVYAHEIAHLLENDPAVSKAANDFLQMRVKERDLKPYKLRTVSPASRFRHDEVGYARKEGDSWVTVVDYEIFDDRKIQGVHNSCYVGKRYPGKSKGGYPSTEIISMGVQQYFNDPIRFAEKDPEYFGLIVAVMNGEI